MTQSRIVHGAVAGIAGGVVFGIMMQMMMAPTPDGQQMPMMKMVAMVVRSDSLTAGWLYHLFNSALIGALFGLVLGGRVISYGTGLWLGAAWGILWWVLGALILMPVLLGMEPFASLRMAPMRPVAMGSLIGHLVYGMLLGAIYSRAEARAPSVPARTSP
ncbi:MAG: DUF6789 family protein [Fimbriimonadales bacterium]